MLCGSKSPATRRYLYRFLTTMAFYVVLLPGAELAFKHYHPTGILAYALAILPALPIVGAIVVVGIYLGEEKDEFQRAMMNQSMIWGIGATLAFTTAWGFLEVFKLAPHLELYLVFPIFCVLAGISSGVLQARYR
jgi:hypothetical protein